MDLGGKQVLVMGLGVHNGGLGVARWLLRQGAHVTVTDLAPEQDLAEPLAALRQTEAETGNSAAYTLGKHLPEDFEHNEIVVANQAVRPDSPWVARARAAGATIESELTLFFRRCTGPILAVTGTKGKTTTTMLLGSMLRQQWPDTVVAGNLRVSALDALDRIGPHTPVALELSSFQLEWLGAAQISPRYAAITNLSPDHLNRHGTMALYAEAKAQIYRWQGAKGVVALNADDLPSHEFFAGPYPGQARWFSLQHEPLPFELDDLQLVGAHNRQNALAAATLAHAFGANAAAIGAGLRAVPAVEHRLELVRELAGVRYVNDTTATNPAAAGVALQSVAGPIILLAGGADKQLEFAAFGQQIAQRVKALVLLAGSASERLHQAVRAHSEQLTVLGPYSDFALAVAAAHNLAEPGDTVLLSPGCASFGMFRNEFHRGDEFRRIVMEATSSQ